MCAALRREAAVKGEAVRRPVERKPRLMISHFNAQALYLRALDIGRIRRDYIETLRNFRKEIRLPEEKRQSRPRTIFRRDRERLRRNVRAERTRKVPVLQKRQRNATASRT